MKIIPEFPEKLTFLFQPMRYKVIHGGRGGGKSWGVARAILSIGALKKIRVLCAREVQTSIKDSVHKLFEDQIQKMGLGKNYEVFDQTIRGINGTEIIFSGLGSMTVESIKSYEGCDYCWVEEAQSISANSWKILIPTIRKERPDPGNPGQMLSPEIWVTFNPSLESDPTYERFVTRPPRNSIVVEMNWRDNPWYNKTMDEERLDCFRNFPKDYPNIWEGKCKPAVEGAIYYDEIQALVASGRGNNVPYDPMLKAHVVFDLGFNDNMAFGVVQKQGSEVRIPLYIQDSHKDLAQYSSILRQRNWNWGKVYLPHADGFNRGSSGQKSADQIMKALGWDVAGKEDVSDLGLEAGLRVARLVFPRVYIDRNNGADLIECLKRYKRNINKQTGEAGAPTHDEFSHGADFFRYVSINEDRMRNDTDRRPQPAFVASYTAQDAGVGY